MTSATLKALTALTPFAILIVSLLVFLQPS